MRDLLVTTALERTWGTDEHLVFLGAWCARYDRRAAWEGRSHETVPFHWDDRTKLDTDYRYLERLHHSLLRSLGSALNDLHRVDRSVRYWQILLDPWLMAFVGSVWDRWECLRMAFASGRELATVAAPDALPRAPLHYTEFIRDLAYGDAWTFDLCGRIIRSEYRSCCEIREAPLDLHAASPSPSGIRRAYAAMRSVAGQLIGALDGTPKAAFIGSYFHPAAEARLQLALGQLPLPASAMFEPDDSTGFASRSTVVRSELRLNFSADSAFESFLSRTIVQCVPQAVVEGFTQLRERALNVRLKPRAIFTANFHWSNAQAKAWMAERTEQGTKLTVMEHGGSFPARKELFDFEEDISDVRATWFLPYHAKHVQLPPSKLVPARGSWTGNRARTADRRYCCIIANETARFVHRAHYYPMASQCLASLSMVLQFHAALTPTVRDAVRVKPQSEQGWSTAQRFVDALGSAHVLRDARLPDVFRMSRVIVCTYPETTFTEAMLSGSPTVMFYPAELYERNPVAFPLLEELRDAHIVFHDAGDAAAHVSAVWSDPQGWWESVPVTAARQAFLRQAADVEGDWVGKWSSFVEQVASGA